MRLLMSPTPARSRCHDHLDGCLPAAAQRPPQLIKVAILDGFYEVAPLQNGERVGLSWGLSERAAWYRPCFISSG